MSDDLRRMVKEMREDLREVRQRLGASERRLERVETALTGMSTTVGEVRGDFADAGRRFDNFLSRFDEAMEMVVQHDTDQLQRNARLEDDLADVKRRVEALERRSPPAA